MMSILSLKMTLENLELHELALDHCYEVIISQAAGLCRYRMRDIVRVVGFFGETPTLEFLGRGTESRFSWRKA